MDHRVILFACSAAGAERLAARDAKDERSGIMAE
jgi:hypothetical protein